MEEYKDIKIWDVSDEVHWLNIMGKKIRKVNINWKAIKYGNRTIHYPQDFELVFEDGKNIFISARLYNKDKDSFDEYSDEVAIFFNNTLTKKYGIGPFNA